MRYNWPGNIRELDCLERFLDHFPSVTREQAVAAIEIAGDLLASRAQVQLA
jgi:transcriptional regulator with PAS, ATPase and Fis domain